MTIASAITSLYDSVNITAERFQADHAGQLLPLAGTNQSGTNRADVASLRFAASFDGGFVF